MIIDEFKCDKCNIVEEHSKPSALSEYEDFKCPSCGNSLRKLFGTPVTDVAAGRTQNKHKEVPKIQLQV